MSMIMGSDFVDANASFTTAVKSSGAKVFVRAFAENGISANTPAAVAEMGSGYNATALVQSIYAYIGVPEGTQAVGAGSWGWFQIRGPVEDVQASAAEASGVAGDSVAWTGDVLYASSSDYQGRHDIGQVGVLTAGANGSTTINMYLTGVWATPI